MKKLLILFALPFVLFSCDALTGEEIGRLKINKVSTDGNLAVEETVLDLKKGDKISIWSDMDMKYEGSVILSFKLEIFKDGEPYQEFNIDPMEKSITINEVKSVLSTTNWKFLGKNKDFKVEEDGKYTFKAFLEASNNSSLKIDKAELVFKKKD